MTGTDDGGAGSGPRRRPEARQAADRARLADLVLGHAFVLDDRASSDAARSPERRFIGVGLQERRHGRRARGRRAPLLRSSGPTPERTASVRCRHRVK